MHMHVKIWLEEDGEVLFGEGRQQLLEAVRDSGSLAGAARQLSMSYRAAWGRLRASEERLGFALVEKSQTGRRAMHLTPAAIKLMDRFAVLRRGADQHTKKAAAKLVRELAQIRKQTPNAKQK